MNKQERIKALYGKSQAHTGQNKGKAIHTPALATTNPAQTVFKPLTIKGLQKPLFPYQQTGVAFIEYKNGRCIIGDSMGLGKTAQSLAFLQYHLEARPAIIICPSSLKLNWAKEVFIWMEKRKENSVYILSGRTHKAVEEVYQNSSGRMLLESCPMPKTGILIINYDVVKDWLPILSKLKPEIVISDESHFLKSGKAKRTKACINLIKQVPKFLALTGTLIENRPIEAYTIINLVSPTLFPSEWKYKMQYCDPVHNGYGWNFKGASNIPELHEKLKILMLRRLKEDVLKDLPPKIRSIVPMEMTNKVEYKAAENNLIAYISKTQGKEKAQKASSVEALAKIAILKNLCLRGKIESCLDWIEDFLDSGEKLIVFTTRTWVINYVYSEFQQCAVKVDGSVTGIKRQEAVDSFQNDKRIRLFVGQIDAAGVGLTLTAASSTCFLDMPFNPSKLDQCEDRCHRIGQTSDTVNAYYLLANNSIEVDIAKILDEKRKIVSSILDGTEVEDANLLTELFKMYEKGLK